MFSETGAVIFTVMNCVVGILYFLGFYVTMRIGLFNQLVLKSQHRGKVQKP